MKITKCKVACNVTLGFMSQIHNAISKITKKNKDAGTNLIIERSAEGESSEKDSLASSHKV